MYFLILICMCYKVTVSHHIAVTMICTEVWVRWCTIGKSKDIEWRHWYCYIQKIDCGSIIAQGVIQHMNFASKGVCLAHRNKQNR